MRLLSRNGKLLGHGEGLTLVGRSELDPPKDAVILDYFSEGYRFGSGYGEDNFGKVDYISPAELGIVGQSRTFGDKIPVAKYEDTRSKIVKTSYRLNDIVDDSVGFTVEYFIKSDYSEKWVRDTLGLGPNQFKIMISYSKTALYGFTYASGRWDWGTIGGLILDTPWYSAWHHIAYTVQYTGSSAYPLNSNVKLYIDGIKRFETEFWLHGTSANDYNIWTSNFMADSNYNTNLGSYSIAQMTVWNYPRYTGEAFELPKKLYID
jgi:hypothetical protein